MTKCRICRAEFQKRSMTHKVCSPECAATLAAKNRDNDQRRETKAKLQALKPRQQWLKEAQSAFNAWIRYRDKDLPCISCQRHHLGQYHAGHYISTGARPALRFNESNVHKQCSACNNYLSGNLVLYRVNLINKIGINEVERLENDTKPWKWTIDMLKAIKADYSQRIKKAPSE